MMNDDWTPGCDVKVDVPNDQKGRHYDVFEEVAAFAQILTHTGSLTQIQEQIRFVRARFGHYDLVDFVAVLIGYMLSGEPTLLTFTTGLLPLLNRSWPCLADIACPIARRFLVFLLLLIRRRWKRFARSFTRICWRANLFLPPVAWSIGEVRSGSWLMWMGRDKQLVNEPCRKRMPYPLPIADLIRSAHQVTLGASEEKLFAPVPLCFKHIRISSSARLLGLATGIIVENCDERSPRSLVTHSSSGFSQPPSSCG
jgi:hypothetical protein